MACPLINTSYLRFLAAPSEACFETSSDSVSPTCFVVISFFPSLMLIHDSCLLSRLPTHINSHSMLDPVGTLPERSRLLRQRRILLRPAVDLVSSQIGVTI